MGIVLYVGKDIGYQEGDVLIELTNFVYSYQERDVLDVPIMLY